MIAISNKAIEQLREQLICKCFEAGIGFRVLVDTGESGKETFSIKLDRQCQGDEVVDSNDIKVFLDPFSAARIGKYQLDYNEGHGGGFFLTGSEEAKSGQS